MINSCIVLHSLGINQKFWKHSSVDDLSVQLKLHLNASAFLIMHCAACIRGVFTSEPLQDADKTSRVPYNKVLNTPTNFGLKSNTVAEKWQLPVWQICCQICLCFIQRPFAISKISNAQFSFCFLFSQCLTWYSNLYHNIKVCLTQGLNCLVTTLKPRFNGPKWETLKPIVRS